MSHLVTVPLQMQQPDGISRACTRLGLPAAVHGKVYFFDGQTREGLCVQFPGWQYPAVINTTTGEIFHDNYNGRWGEQVHLDNFCQAYATEVAKMTAEAQGYQVEEQLMEDGSIALNVIVSH